MELPVEKILKDKGIDFKLIELSQKAYTVNDVKKYSDEEIVPEEICKTIILAGKKTGKKVAVLLRGSDRLNFKQAKKLFGEEMRIADAEEVKSSEGGEIGAVCPFLVKILLFIDRKVLDLKKINCGSGNHLYGLEIQVADIERFSNSQTADLTQK